MTDRITELVKLYRQRQEREDLNRNWYLRCDAIRRREAKRNLKSVLDEIHGGATTIKDSLPEESMCIIREEHALSGKISIQRSSKLFAINVELSTDGAVLEVRERETRLFRVCIEGDDTYFVDEKGNHAKVSDIAEWAFNNFVESFR